MPVSESESLIQEITAGIITTVIPKKSSSSLPVYPLSAFSR